MSNATLKKKIFIKGEIEAKTGLSIGGTNIGIEIGGIDRAIIRDPITNQPYIPGSSLKGKMRSLLERVDKGDDINHEVVKGENVIKIHICKQGEPCPICKLFGLPADPEIKKELPSRLIVRDCKLRNYKDLEKSKFIDMPYTEVKTEVVICRITSKANPRQFERVPAGAKFDLELICDIYENDDEAELINTIFKGLKLLQDDYLGGCGTRGYGKVKIRINEIKYKDKEIYERNLPAKEYEIEIPEELR